MKQQKKWLVSMLVGLVGLTISAVSSAETVPLDNRLPAWGDFGYPRIDFTNIDVRYTNGKTSRRGVAKDGVFFAEDNSLSTFTLQGPGYDGVAFDGGMVIDAKISSRGVLRAGSTFGIYSNDAMFTGPVVNYGCNQQGKNCSSGKLVFGGDLIAFGWSGSLGILEFGTTNLAGWAKDLWTPNSGNEHIYMDVGPFDLNNVSSVKSFTATADGFAVVPVPAAVWLLGSGLLGLVGVARRQRQS